MGRKGGKPGGKRANRWDSKIDKKNLKPNDKWVAYYKAQNIVKDDSDWDAMVGAFMRPLPASLRINFDCPYGDRLKQELLEFCGPSETSDVSVMKTLDWYPDGRGFQLALDRNTIRNSEDPNLRRLHQWLICHTESGMLTRQEAVSMIPPCILQVEPHHMVLDMCASPGSKTTQMLEVIQNAVKVGPQEPQGMVVANDCDTQRAYMLAHQCKRINSPALVITTHLGQFFPNLKRKGDKSSGVFDRVLADVPCSGDGTIRKQPSIMATWGCHAGAALHPLQLDIALRGANLCKVGGLMVYSTCSLNPVENEAVVAALIQRANGALVLEDTANIIPQLKRRPGLSEWRVLEEGIKPDSRKAKKMAEKQARKLAALNEEGQPPIIAEPEAAAEEPAAVEEEEPETDEMLKACKDIGLRHYRSYDQVLPNARGRIKKGMFAPPLDATIPLRAADGSFLGGNVPLHLERCMRCVPHDEDTGGFFVALVRKVCELDNFIGTSPEGKEDAVAQEEDEDEAPAAKKAKMEENMDQSTSSNNNATEEEAHTYTGSNVHGEYYRPVEQDIIQEVRKFFGVNEKFPFDQLYARNDGAPKTITFVTKTVKENVIDSVRQDRIKIVLTGLKMFEKNSANNVCECRYRLVHECAHIIEPFMDDSRKIIFKPSELAKLVNRDELNGGVLSLQGMSVAPAIKALSPGAFLAISNDTTSDEKLLVVCWRGRSDNNINVMCNKDALHIVGQRLVDMGVEVSFPVAQTKAQKANQAEEPATDATN